MKKLKCSRCGEILTTCDSGYGHKFKAGEKIYCKKRRPKERGNLHFCDDSEMKEAIVDKDIDIRTYGERAIVKLWVI